VCQFLHPENEPALSPFDMPGMYQALGVLRWALSRRRRIVVYGDYDVDGLTSTALLLEGLAGLGCQASYHIPNRLDTGYGLDRETVGTIAQHADVLITVDCGIRALEEIALARRLGMNVVVTDHHMPGPELPPADAVVCPRLAGGEQFGALASVGIAAHLLQGLFAVESRFGSAAIPSQCLDLVALGTVADMAPLVGENRRLVKSGLKHIHRSARPGIDALSRIAGLDPKEISASHISFALAPRINAVGRFGSSKPALELLLTRSMTRALALAQILDTINRRRQKSVERSLALARNHLDRQGETKNIVFTASEEYHPGVVGLMASRLMDELGLPAVVVSIQGDVAHGSMRSTPGLHASGCLDSCAYLLRKHGGHALAAGFTCDTANLGSLREALEEFASRRDSLADRSTDGKPSLVIDAETQLLDGGHSVWEWLPRLEPTGCGNERPLFLTRRARVISKRLFGRKQQHLGLQLGSDGASIAAVGFGMAQSFGAIGAELDIVYHLDERSYNGKVERRLLLVDFSS